MERVQSLEIYETYGTKACKITMPAVLVISGANGTGKSSLIKALTYMVDGGGDSGVIRIDESGVQAEKSVVTITMDDGRTYCKTTTKKGFHLDATFADGSPIPSAQHSLNEALGDPQAVDPAKLMRIDASTKDGHRELTKALLKAMPIEFPGDKIRASIGVDDTLINAAIESQRLYTLEGLAAIRLQVYKARTKCSVSADEQDSAINQWRKTLPADGEDRDWDAEIKHLEMKYKSIQQTRDVAISQMRNLENGELDRLRKEFEANCEEVREQSETARTAAVEHHAPDLEAVSGEIQVARRTQKQQIAIEATRTNIDLMSKRMRENRTQSDGLTKALDALDKLRQDKLENLPVEGLLYTPEGKITIDGLPWEHVNTARRVDVVAQLCLLRGARMLCVDDAEHLTPETWAAFLAWAKGSGRQVISTIAMTPCSECGIEMMRTNDGPVCPQCGGTIVSYALKMEIIA